MLCKVTHYVCHRFVRQNLGHIHEYTSDLLSLEFCRPSPEQSQTLMEVRTPLRAEPWDRALASHPDRAFTRYISHGPYMLTEQTTYIVFFEYR